MAQRDKKRGTFRSQYTDDDLYRLIGLVASVARAADAEKLTMVEFDAHSAPVATANKMPSPPTARAIQMRLGKPWRQVVAGAVSASAGDAVVEHLVGSAKRTDEWPDLDEAHIHYAMRRVAAFLKVETLSEIGYDSGRSDLIESVSRAEARLLEEILPTASQIRRVAYDDWERGLALVGMQPEPRQFTGHSMVKLCWHYYETKSRLPTETRLRDYVNGELDRAMPRGRDRKFSEYVDELRAARADRGWSTPEDGPADGETLSDEELTALLEGAPRRQARGGWTEERVEEAFVEYVREYLGRADLRQKHYLSVRGKHRWPSNQAYSRYATFGKWIERGKQRIAQAAERQEAAQGTYVPCLRESWTRDNLPATL
jgi:hypothetical protein